VGVGAEVWMNVTGEGGAPPGPPLGRSGNRGKGEKKRKCVEGAGREGVGTGGWGRGCSTSGDGTRDCGLSSGWLVLGPGPGGAGGGWGGKGGDVGGWRMTLV